jgi:predicted amidohydrolase
VIDALALTIATMPIRRYGALAEFASHVDALARDAAAAGSRLLLLPELTCVGLLWSDPQAGAFNARGVGELYRRVLTRQFDAYRDALARIARARGIWIAGASCWHELDGAGLNSGFVVSPDGTVVQQDKLHPTRGEVAIGTRGGDRLQSVLVDGVRVGLLICYDLQFPELTRHLVAQGVDVLLVPSLTSERGYWRVRHAAHARALENQIYACVSPLVGNLGIPSDYPLEATGGAYVACPIDNRFALTDGTYARSEPDVPGLLHARLDLDLLGLSRSKSEIRQRADRRPDLYSQLAR